MFPIRKLYSGRNETNQGFFQRRVISTITRLRRNAEVCRAGFPACQANPAVPARTKEDWIQCLESTRVVEQLSALVWLTGAHLSSREERKTDHNQESVSDAKLFESVCDAPRTASLLAKLKKSKNQWVQDYAKLGPLKEDNQ